MLRRRLLSFAMIAPLALPALWSCSGDGAAVGPDASLALLVGDWEAERLSVRRKADPTNVVDLIAEGARFTLNIQPSGQYTAILAFQGVPTTEIGSLEIDGSEIVMTVAFRNTEPVTGTSRSRYTLAGNLLTLDGETEFPFTLRGPEAADAHIELRKR